MTGRPSKTCQSCGRTIEWRKAWERDWESVRYCSDGCRKHKPGAAGAALEQAILDLLAQRAGGATICPSEAARAVAPSGWEKQMEPARAAARRLVARGLLVITQGGRVVDPSTARGPIRLRRVPPAIR